MIKWFICVALVVVAFYVIKLFFFTSPFVNGDWIRPYKIPAVIVVNNKRITASSIRDFSYAENGDIRDERYLDKTYDLSKLKNVWYGISHFGAQGMAHVFLSFEFSDDESASSAGLDQATNQMQKSEYLAISIEAKLQKSNAGYSPLDGLLRKYNKTIVFATERDVIGLRSHIRKEKAYLYELNLNEETKKQLLTRFIKKHQTLEERPEFYNTIFDNCMTGLLDEAGYEPLFRFLDYRVLLPGYSDRLAYSLGIIDNKELFEEARKNALIEIKGYSPSDSDFSTKIRKLGI